MCSSGTGLKTENEIFLQGRIKEVNSSVDIALFLLIERE